MKLLKKSEIVLLAIMLAGIGILTCDGLSSKSQPKRVDARSEFSRKAVQKPNMTKRRSRPKVEFTEDKVAQVLIDNDLDTLERFLDYLREEDDWRKMKMVADSLFSIPGWGSRVSEDAQDHVLDAISEHTPHTLPELLGFLESEYEDVREDALDEIADAIEESEDEKGMCSLISMLSDTVDNLDFAERMIVHMDMMDLTHDVSNAMMHILSKGTPAFKKALSDFLIDGEYAEKNEKTALAYGVGEWLSERLAEEADD